MGEMAWGFLARYLSLTFPMRGIIRHKELKTLVSFLLLEMSPPPKCGKRSTETNKHTRNKTKQDKIKCGGFRGAMDLKIQTRKTLEKSRAS